MNQKLNMPLPVHKLRPGQILSVEIENTSYPWAQDLLNEVNGIVDLNEIHQDSQNKKTFLKFEGELSTANRPILGDVYLVSGLLSLSFYSQCGKSGLFFIDHLEVEINSVFISESFKSRPEYAELTEIDVKGEVYELYFVENKCLDLQSLFREYIYINKESYPILEEFADTNL